MLCLATFLCKMNLAHLSRLIKMILVAVATAGEVSHIARKIETVC